ncbi:MAG: hypothetical protein ACK53A_03580 [Gemmatimonadota bacterium]|jgi:hypothetical protein|nr:hypothetical protein [Gemmatimonadota bacterium]
MIAGVVALAALVPGRPAPAQAGDGYLFRMPPVAVTLRGGLQAPAVRSDFWSFTTDQLTLDRRKLAGAAWGVDLSRTVSERWEWQLSVDWLARGADSEYRRFEEQLENDRRAPIRQRTELQRLPVTLGVRLNLLPDGERIGRHAWLPSAVVPFVVAGGGASWYRIRQRGDFVDFADGNAIFFDDYESSGVGLLGFAGAGVDVSVNPFLAVTTQVRALVGNARLGRDFRGFAPLDLSGATLTTGVRLRLP